MYFPKRFARADEPHAISDHGGNGVGQVGCEILKGGVDDAAEPARREPPLASGPIDGHDATNFERGRQLLFGGFGCALLAGISQDFKLWLYNLEFTAAINVNLAVQCDHLARLEFALQVRPIKPDALEPGSALPRCHLKYGHAACAEKP